MKITEFVNGFEGPAGYYAEGHHEAGRFVRAIRGYTLAREGTPMTYDAVDVRHKHLVASLADPKGPESDLALDFLDEPNESSEPVTVIFT